MKKLAILALTVLVVAAMSSTVLANDVVVTFDNTGLIGEAAKPAFVLFQLYAIGQEIGDVVGWELAFTPPAGITVSGRVVSNGPGVNLGGDDNYIIGLGNCYGTPGTDYLFIQYDLVYLAAPPANDLFCVDVPSANGAEQGFLAYVDCSNNVQELGKGNKGCGFAPDGCAVINPSDLCVVSNEATTWGAVKAAY